MSKLTKRDITAMQKILESTDKSPRKVRDEPGRVEYKTDEAGNIVYKRWEDGSEEFFTYDERGNIVYRKETRPENVMSFTGQEDGDHEYEEWFEYDDDNNFVSIRNSLGLDKKFR